MEKTLTFEEFTKYDNGQIYDNFIVHWVGGWGTKYSQKQPHYIKFKKENGKLEERLSKNLKGMGLGPELKEFEKDLYEAYVVMMKNGSSHSELSIANY